MNNKIREIVNGWIKYLNPIKQKEVREMSENRLMKCMDCDKNSTYPEINGLQSVCGECKCPLLPKSFSKESNCPLNKW